MKPRVIGRDADTLDLTCSECGNATSCAERAPGVGICVFCLNERVQALRTAHFNRFKRTPFDLTR